MSSAKDINERLFKHVNKSSTYKRENSSPSKEESWLCKHMPKK